MEAASGSPSQPRASEQRVTPSCTAGRKSSRSRCRRRTARAPGTAAASICSMRVSRMDTRANSAATKKALARMSMATATNSSSESPCIPFWRIAFCRLADERDSTWPGASQLGTWETTNPLREARPPHRRCLGPSCNCPGLVGWRISFAQSSQAALKPGVRGSLRDERRDAGRHWNREAAPCVW